MSAHIIDYPLPGDVECNPSLQKKHYFRNIFFKFAINNIQFPNFIVSSLDDLINLGHNNVSPTSFSFLSPSPNKFAQKHPFPIPTFNIIKLYMFYSLQLFFSNFIKLFNVIPSMELLFFRSQNILAKFKIDLMKNKYLG